MRPRHEGGIADDGDAPEGQARTFQIVDRLQDRLVDQADDGAELRRQQSLRRGAHGGDGVAADERRRDRDRMGDAAVVGEEPGEFGVLVGRPVPHDIAAAVAWRADRRSARRPDRTGIARRAAGRTPWTRTARGGSPAEWRSQGGARATRNSRRKAGRHRAGIGRAPWSASRRRRSARRLPRCCRRSYAPARAASFCSKALSPRPR